MNTAIESGLFPLAQGFPVASREAWLALVDQTLKGRDPAELTTRTYDGLALEALYTADGAPALADAARPRPRDAGSDDAVWDVRTVVDHCDPTTANTHVLTDLQGGASSILLRLDPSGAGGVAVGSAADLARALAGMELELATIALDAGFVGPLAADWLGQAAKASPRAQLAFHLDPLGALAQTGRSPGPIDACVLAASQGVARLADIYPRASLFLASGRVIHEAGGGEALELGFLAACALAYAKALTAAGFSLQEAFSRIVLSLSADADYFLTLAKFRAVRAIWARMTTACGVSAPARLEGRSSRRMLSRLDPWVNLLRNTAAGFGAAVGGADALMLEPFTQPLGRPTTFARRQARNTQLVLMQEAQITRVADPAGGAWSVEAMTDQLARAGWAEFQSIERRGGAAAALRDGSIAAHVAQTRSVREAEVASRTRTLVGVTAFPAETEIAVEVETVDLARFAKPDPLPPASGDDDVCAPLRPYREAQAHETLAKAAGP